MPAAPDEQCCWTFTCPLPPQLFEWVVMPTAPDPVTVTAGPPEEQCCTAIIPGLGSAIAAVAPNSTPPTARDRTPAVASRFFMVCPPEAFREFPFHLFRGSSDSRGTTQ